MPDEIKDQELENVAAGASMHYEAYHKFGLLSHVYYQPASGEKVKAQIDKTGTGCYGNRNSGNACYKIAVDNPKIYAWYWEPDGDTFTEQDKVDMSLYRVCVDQS